MRNTETQEEKSEPTNKVTKILKLVLLRLIVPTSWHSRDSEGSCRLFEGVLGVVVVEPKGVGTGEGVTSVEGSMSNAVSVLDTVAMTHIYRKHANSPSENESLTAMSTRLSLLLPQSGSLRIRGDGVKIQRQTSDTDWNHEEDSLMRGGLEKLRKMGGRVLECVGWREAGGRVGKEFQRRIEQEGACRGRVLTFLVFALKFDDVKDSARRTLSLDLKTVLRFSAGRSTVILVIGNVRPLE